MPTDPSGSLYLSRMADFSAAHPLGLGRRRLFQQQQQRVYDVAESTSTVRSTIPQEPGRKLDLNERANEYDRALKASQMARRRNIGTSALMQSRLGPGPSASSIFQSNAGLNLNMAQTAVLGDSQGSTVPQHLHSQQPSESVIPEEDLVSDGGVVSALGESYVDGKRPQISVSQSQKEEDEEMEDGGVLGLLAQIYGTGVDLKGKGGGPGRRI